MKKILLLIILSNFYVCTISAQTLDTLPFSGKTYYNWYFGIYAGVTFDTPDREPIFLPNNILISSQNTTSISDKVGNFLFHSDGELLENFKHQIINRDMGGNNSQNQGSVIAPLYGNRFIFFTCLFANEIFNEKQFDPPRNLNDTTGLVYSIFSYDYNADTLIFEVYKKQLDENYQSEAIELSYSALTGNYILVGIEDKGEIRAYEFDLYGNFLRKNKQLFFVLAPKSNGQEIRVNQMCDKIVVGSSLGYYKKNDEQIKTYQNSYAYVLNFDAKKLEFYNYKIFDFGLYNLGPLEFSTNSNYIYTMLVDLDMDQNSTEFLKRIDLRKNEIENIFSGKIPKSKDYRSINDFTMSSANPIKLRIGPNDKIYLFRQWANHLSSIENPNSKTNPNYKLDPVYFEEFDGIKPYGNQDSPQFISASFAPVYVRSEIILCEGEKLELFAKTQLPDTVATYSWEGPKNYKSEEQYPTIENIQLDQAGLYTVTVHSQGKIYTAETFVRVKPSPKPVLKAFPDKFVCGNEDIFLSLTEKYSNYHWTTGDTTEFIKVTKSGTYGVTVTNDVGCEAYVEMKVGFARDYNLPIKGDTVKCKGEAVTLTSVEEFPEYKWSNGATTRSITVIQPAKYTLTVKTEEGCTISRTIEVKNHPEVKVELKPVPTTICYGDSTLLESKYDVPYYSYLWSTGDTTRGIYVNSTGTYKLKITDTRTGCTDGTEIAIKVEDNLQPTITGSNICSGESATLTALPNDPSYTYKWSNGETSPVITVSQAGTYSVTVSKNGCSGVAEFTVNESPSPEFEILGESIICNNETATLTASKDFAEYHWSTNEISKEIEVSEAGTYTLTVTDDDGCSATKSFKVDKYVLSFDISKGSIDFGKVYITETKSDKTTITNHSGFEIKLDNGQLVADGQSYPFNYDFVPTQLGVFANSIVIHVIEPCDTVITIPITARVYARTTISTKDIYTQIGRTETVPVYLQCEADLPSQEYTITTDIDRSAFNTQDSYTINQNQPINKTKTKIHQLTGTILLSDKLEYDITFPNYSFTNPYIEVIEEPGKIYIDSVCIFPYRNVLLSEPTTLETNPNPATEQLNISITTGVQGAMKLELVSTEGRVIYTDTWQQSTRSKELQINTRAIPSGLYQVRLITPIDAVTKNVVVVE